MWRGVIINSLNRLYYTEPLSCFSVINVDIKSSVGFAFGHQMSSLATEVKSNEFKRSKIKDVPVRCGGDTEHVSCTDPEDPPAAYSTAGGLWGLRTDWV